MAFVSATCQIFILPFLTLAAGPQPLWIFFREWLNILPIERAGSLYNCNCSMDSSLLDASTGNSTLDAIALASGAATKFRIVEWAVLFGIVVFFTTLRTFARARVSGLGGLGCDDALVWLAVIGYGFLTTSVYVIGVKAEGLANDGIPDDRRAALAQDADGQETQLRLLGSKAQIVKWFLYALVLWLLKGSLLHFFAVRLTVSQDTPSPPLVSPTSGPQSTQDLNEYS